MSPKHTGQLVNVQVVQLKRPRRPGPTFHVEPGARFASASESYPNTSGLGQLRNDQGGVIDGDGGGQGPLVLCHRWSVCSGSCAGTDYAAFSVRSRDECPGWLGYGNEDLSQQVGGDYGTDSVRRCV